MTRFILISIFFLAMISFASFTASAGNNSEPVSTSNSVPTFPATKTVPPLHPEQKAHTPKLDELPHVHHFHKERVKKVKRHHKKVWTISMLLLVLCHISILVMAYMHVAPH